MPSRELVATVVLAATLGLTGCSASSEALGEASDSAAQAVPVKGSELSRVTLSREAYDRLAIATAAVRGGVVRGSTSPTARTVMPSAALLYDSEGRTWAYVREGARSFLRAPVTIARLDGDRAYLSDGPAPGTQVVVVGAPELLGVELGVEGE
jgi:hypothetical protein